VPQIDHFPQAALKWRMRKGNGYREVQFKVRVPALLRAQDKTLRPRRPKRNNPNLFLVLVVAAQNRADPSRPSFQCRAKQKKRSSP